PLTADVLCEQKTEAIANFWGDTVKLDEGTGLTWMRQQHYYMGLYPYTYSAGLTVSTAVLQRIKLDPDVAISDWLDVLKAGGSLTPLRSEEHTSELQSRFDLVCRLLLEKKKYTVR